MVKLVLLPVKATRTFVRLAGVRGALLLAVGVWVIYRIVKGWLALRMVNCR